MTEATRPDQASIRATTEAAARLLDRIAQLLALKGESPYRVRAYAEAAANLRASSDDLLSLWRAGRLRTIPGVGQTIAGRLDEFFRTGQSRYLAELEASLPDGIEQLLRVTGIGPTRARLLAERLNLKSPEELAEAARDHRLQGLPGFGPRLEARLLAEALRWAQHDHRLLLGIAWPAADELLGELRSVAVLGQSSVAGSLRRMVETIGDLDLLGAAADPELATTQFANLPAAASVLAQGPTKASILLDNGLQADLRVVEPRHWGAALQYFTGSKRHNIALRDLALARGLRLNEYGLFDQATGRRIASETEADVYEALDLAWIPPELREDRGEIQAAENGQLPALIELADLQGDLHCHTNWTDGTASLEAMADAARDFGLTYLAITDHSEGLSIAHGLTPEQFREQRRLVVDLNCRLAPFRILHGAEVDIRPDGLLDLPDDLLAELDFVGVSIHTRFRMARDEMTARIMRAIRHPLVNVLNHPTGRRINVRPGYEVDLDAVLRLAARLDVAVEINSQIDRLDLNDEWARRARDLGCRLAIDSDAHSPDGFANLRYGVAVARRGWVESKDALNTLPLPHLLAALRRKRRRVA
jgi:DNA polymerase (family 10)